LGSFCQTARPCSVRRPGRGGVRFAEIACRARVRSAEAAPRAWVRSAKLNHTSVRVGSFCQTAVAVGFVLPNPGRVSSPPLSLLPRAPICALLGNQKPHCTNNRSHPNAGSQGNAA
jgi:hypothetical protein